MLSSVRLCCDRRTAWRSDTRLTPCVAPALRRAAETSTVRSTSFSREVSFPSRWIVAPDHQRDAVSAGLYPERAFLYVRCLFEQTTNEFEPCSFLSPYSNYSKTCTRLAKGTRNTVSNPRCSVGMADGRGAFPRCSAWHSPRYCPPSTPFTGNSSPGRAPVSGFGVAFRFGFVQARREQRRNMTKTGTASRRVKNNACFLPGKQA